MHSTAAARGRRHPQECGAAGEQPEVLQLKQDWSASGHRRERPPDAGRHPGRPERCNAFARPALKRGTKSGHPSASPAPRFLAEAAAKALLDGRYPPAPEDHATLLRPDAVKGRPRLFFGVTENRCPVTGACHRMLSADFRSGSARRFSRPRAGGAHSMPAIPFQRRTDRSRPSPVRGVARRRHRDRAGHAGAATGSKNGSRRRHVHNRRVRLGPAHPPGPCPAVLSRCAKIAARGLFRTRPLRTRVALPCTPDRPGGCPQRQSPEQHAMPFRQSSKYHQPGIRRLQRLHEAPGLCGPPIR